MASDTRGVSTHPERRPVIERGLSAARAATWNGRERGMRVSLAEDWRTVNAKGEAGSRLRSAVAEAEGRGRPACQQARWTRDSPQRRALGTTLRTARQSTLVRH